MTELGVQRLSRRAALPLVLLSALGARPALAEIPVFTKTCVDLNGGEVCADDWIRCTLHVEVTDAQERFVLTDRIPSAFYQQWRQVPPTPPPPANNVSQREGQNPLVADGIYSYANLTMNPGSAFDFVYEAQVKANGFGAQSCSSATIRNVNLRQWASNFECVTYDCIVPGPNTLATKSWVGPPPIVGDAVQFTIVLTNTGTAPDTNVRLTDTLDALRWLPPTVVFTPPPTSGGVTGNVIDATWATLGVGETITVTIDTFYANCTSFGMDAPCNQGVIRSVGITATDPSGQRLTDDPDTFRFADATCRSTNAGGSPQIQEPPVKRMTDVDGPPLDLNDVIHVQVTFVNTSVCGATFGRFEDAIPAEFRYVNNSTVVTPPSGASSFDAGTRTVIVDNFSVPGQSTTTIEFDLRVDDLGTGTLCNTAQYRFGLSNLLDTTTACVGAPVDTDGDTIADDGGGSGVPGDEPCTGGATAGCDDNCPSTPNAGQADADADLVGDACDACPGFDDAADGDGDGVADGCDACRGADDRLDGDGDTAPDACDTCPGQDDRLDADVDTVPDACDACPGGDDRLDADGDGVPNGCDACPGADDSFDADGDGAPDACDACPGEDDRLDADTDTVPDACDACPGLDDRLDADTDDVPDGCDNCPFVANGPAEDDQSNRDSDLAGDACDPCPDDSTDACAVLLLLRNADVTARDFGQLPLWLTPGGDPVLDAVRDFAADVTGLPDYRFAGDAAVVGQGNPGVLIFYEVDGAAGPIFVRKDGSDVVVSGW